MLILAFILVAGGLAVIAFGGIRVYLGHGDSDGEAGGSVYLWMSGWLGKGLKFVAPALVVKYRPQCEKMVAFSGMDEQAWTAETVMGSFVAGGIGGVILFALLFSWNPVLLVLGGFAAGLYIIWSKWKGLGTERQSRIAREFPYVLDLFYLCIHSGQGIQSSIQQIKDAIKAGPIHEEFLRVLNTVRNGNPLSEAFRRMSDRVAAPEVRSVLLALIQAVDRGSQLGETLKAQAEQLRFDRMMKVEEQIEKLPTKMLLPIVLFILPCTFIVAIGPMILSCIRSFR